MDGCCDRDRARLSNSVPRWPSLPRWDTAPAPKALGDWRILAHPWLRRTGRGGRRAVSAPDGVPRFLRLVAGNCLPLAQLALRRGLLQAIASRESHLLARPADTAAGT